jgi:hypothetical protein
VLYFIRVCLIIITTSTIDAWEVHYYNNTFKLKT